MFSPETSPTGVRGHSRHIILAWRFGIHPDTGYKWLERWIAGERALSDRSRRPYASRRRTEAGIEAAVLAIRDAHPAWGGRKIARCLARDGVVPPAGSTVHAILRRHDRVVLPAVGPRATQRFEQPAPNLLWRMDFKGWVKLVGGAICHPLTIIDDHSRYVPCLAACADERGATVRSHLQARVKRYGLPDALFVDNGGPWADASGARWTRLSVWLLKRGVAVWRSRPYHPQSRGKNERFHRTLIDEVFALCRLHDLAEAQRAFDQWRDVYNFERTHEAPGQDTPASRYQPSPRAMPARLPEPDYDAGEGVRLVPATKAYVRFKGRLWKGPQAFRSERVAIRPVRRDGQFAIWRAFR